MKRIIFLLLNIFPISSFAADYTISVKASGQSMFFYKKSDNSKLGEFINVGGINAIKTSSGQIQLGQVLNIVFSNPSCTGTMYVQLTPFGIVNAIVYNNGSYYRMTGYNVVVPIQSRLDASTGNCDAISANLNVVPAELVIDTTGLIPLTNSGIFDTSTYYFKAE